MALTIADSIHLPKRLYNLLKRFVRKRNSPHWLVQRSRIILGLSRGLRVGKIARELQIDRKSVTRWRARWLQGIKSILQGLSTASPPSLEQRVITLLSDAPRSGTPATFSAQQLTQIIALACEAPQASGYPISHWSAREIAIEASKRGIVESISERSVNRLLADMELKPHRSRYWLNANPDCSETFKQEVMEVCEVYESAPELAAQGIRLASVDEKPGIQALERSNPTQLAQPGHLEQREYEYIRHGTCTLIASLDVCNGSIMQASLGPTRTESDFANHIEVMLQRDPNAKWIIICVQLNTHKSESLVRLVARHCAINDDLGDKGKSGILKSMNSRAALLSDPSHRIRLLYTPKHTSWLNQIEGWFSILSRKLIKRGNFTSSEDLQTQINAFIDYFNETLAKPFKWKFKPCRWPYSTPLEKAA
ncbi:MAG: IS630 family transposase [Cyanobacteria bacterium P01_F01_bin.150]